jgi:hypothetical protein
VWILALWKVSVGAPVQILGQAEMTRSDRVFLAIYFGSHKVPIAVCSVLRAADAGIRAVVTGLWLGVLTPRMLRRLDQWYYTRGFPMYQDPDYNRSGWHDWEEPVIEQYFAGLRKVLIAAGAGAGREVLALNRMGVDAVGYECNHGLVDAGNKLLAQEGFAPVLRTVEPDRAGADDEQYDGVIIGWATYSLIPGQASRIQFLKQARTRCGSRAPLLISFFPREAERGFYRLSTAIANSTRTVLRRPKVEFGDTLAASWAHYFSREEIEKELRAGGFEPVLFRSQPYAHAVGLAVE